MPSAPHVRRRVAAALTVMTARACSAEILIGGGGPDVDDLEATVLENGS